MAPNSTGLCGMILLIDSLPSQWLLHVHRYLRFGSLRSNLQKAQTTRLSAEDTSKKLTDRTKKLPETMLSTPFLVPPSPRSVS